MNASLFFEFNICMLVQSLYCPDFEWYKTSLLIMCMILLRAIPKRLISSILAKMSPSGSAMIIMIADANHETASESAIMPKLYIARYR